MNLHLGISKSNVETSKGEIRCPKLKRIILHAHLSDVLFVFLFLYVIKTSFPKQIRWNYIHWISLSFWYPPWPDELLIVNRINEGVNPISHRDNGDDVNISVPIILCCRGFPMHCRAFGSVPGSYPLVASSAQSWTTESGPLPTPVFSYSSLSFFSWHLLLLYETKSVLRIARINPSREALVFVEPC